MPDPRDLLPQPPWIGPLPEVKMSYGHVVQVGSSMVKDLMLPDWNLVYIEYPPWEVDAYRRALRGIQKVKVTKQRIYFVQ